MKNITIKKYWLVDDYSYNIETSEPSFEIKEVFGFKITCLHHGYEKTLSFYKEKVGDETWIQVEDEKDFCFDIKEANERKEYLLLDRMKTFKRNIEQYKKRLSKLENYR